MIARALGIIKASWLYQAKRGGIDRKQIPQRTTLRCCGGEGSSTSNFTFSTVACYSQELHFLCIIYQMLLPSLTLLHEQADPSQAGQMFILGLWLILLHLPSQECDLLTCVYAAQWSWGMAVAVIHCLEDNDFKGALFACLFLLAHLRNNWTMSDNEEKPIHLMLSCKSQTLG